MTLSDNQRNLVALLGRVLIALLFVPAGFNKLLGFAGTAGYIASMGVPLPEVAAAIGIVVELGLGLTLLVGYQTRWSALLIALFTIVITFIFHAFWAAPADKLMMQQLQFFKNMAITGGLFAIVGLGAGGWSLDAKRGQA